MPAPETTGRSLIHRLAGYEPGARPPSGLRVYLATLFLTYIPLAAAILVEYRFYPDHQLRFFQDPAVTIVLVVALPLIVLMTIRDDHELSTALQGVQERGVLKIRDASWQNARRLFFRRSFAFWNVVTQIAAILLGLGLAIATVRQLTRSGSDHIWVCGSISAGAYGYALTILYAAILIYVWRCVAMAVFLKRLVAKERFQMLPFHPDKCGGLQPVGWLGLRNQYLLTVLGVNVAALIIWSWRAEVKEIAIAGAVAYVVLGPVVFMGPLLPFRAGMNRAKREWMSDTQHWIEAEFARIRPRMRDGKIGKEDEDALDRMRKVSAIIDDLPVWPLDATTLRKFTTAYAFPVVSLAVSKIIEILK